MTEQYVLNLKETKETQNIGNKAQRLHFLAKRGFQTPVTYVCMWDAYVRYLEDDATIINGLKSELSNKLDKSCSYAVRSSANIEDSFDHSFAGQFKTVLNVQGIDNLLQSMWSIWATAQSPAVQAYLHRNGIDPHVLRMALIIQNMVPPVVSGISFSKNPLTGLDEVIVEAVKGSGQALVQEGVTPQRWTNKWGAWVLKPEQEDIELELVQDVVHQTKAIAKAFGRPVDLEWVYDGNTVYWVQLREITSLNINVYSNHISKEVLPGIIKPLVWSVNVPLVNGAWVRLFTELIGPNDIDPDSLARSFYCRAYFNMGAIGQLLEQLGLPRESLELLMGIERGGADKPSFRPGPKTYTLLPRMLYVAAGKLRFARKVEAFLPVMEERYQSFHIDQINPLSEGELLDEINRLYALTQETAYYNIVTPLLMQIYNRLLKSQLARISVDFESFDLTGDMDELQQFEPNVHLTKLNREYQDLDEDLRSRLSESSYDEFCQLLEPKSMRREVERFIDQFGHLSDSGNDFSSVPWRENPDLILKMIMKHKPPENDSPRKLNFEGLQLSAIHRPLFRWIHYRARRFRFYREAVSSLYTRGYGLFRVYFLALGDHFVRRGLLASREDIFYLQFDEIKDIVEGLHPYAEIREKVARRRCEIEQSRDIIPPSVIYGDQPLPPNIQTHHNLVGTATSRGQYTGPVKVVQGIHDFDKVEEGDVLVIPYSDVGWTPLFTKVGAVIAESGGMLSHSSIIAREYSIPAVVSVPSACSLKDNTVVTVDGYRGEVVIHEPA